MSHYASVPKDRDANLQYRADLMRQAEWDEGVREFLLEACRTDILFFYNAMCWVYEPRPAVVNGIEEPKARPFITWDHQDPVIREMDKHLGTKDIGAEKSRGEGFSWMACMKALYDWLFKPGSKIGLVSRNMDLADNPKDPDSLFWKIDWQMTMLPAWMAGVKDEDWERNVSKHTLYNHRNGSSISAYAATAAVGRGGRYSWFFFDELGSFTRGDDYRAVASVQQATYSRFFVSTPEGSEGAYYDVMHEGSNMERIRIHWSQNQTRNRGLYKLVKGVPVAVDPVENPLPPEYDPPSEEVKQMYARLRTRGFRLEGKLRSPWYDNECDRAGATPSNIARELDIDYGGSTIRVFRPEFFDKAGATVMEPFCKGHMNYSVEGLEPDFEVDPMGDISLWMKLDVKNRPPPSMYVLGCDVGSGVGGSHTSNSTIIGFDQMTMEQVLEIAVSTIEQSDFGDLAIAVAKWLHGAYLAWEANFCGGFTKRIRENGYANVYYRTVQWRRGHKTTKELGWWTDERTKEAMFSEFSRATRNGEIKLRSHQLVTECQQYVRLGGKIEHVGAVKGSKDGAGKSHGDRVIGAGVALQAIKERPYSPIDVARQAAPANSMAARIREYEDAQHAEGDEWDDQLAGNMSRSRSRSVTTRSRLMELSDRD